MSQLKALEAGIIKRNELAVRYDEALVQFPIKKLELTANVQRSSYHLYVILLESREVRDSFFHFMRKKNIGVQLHYFPVHLQPFYMEHFKQNRSLKNAEAYGDTAISIPLHPKLTHSEQDYVIESISEFFYD